MAEFKYDIPVTARRMLRRSRASSLRQLAASLPSVDHALDELIARANQTELDVGGWNTRPDFDHANHSRELRDPGPASEALDAEALDTESLDVGLLETKLRDAEAREQALRQQLEHLQEGGRAEVEPRTAVAEPRTAVAEPRTTAAQPLAWLAVGGAFLAGIALMFAVARLTGLAGSAAGALTGPEAERATAMPGPTITPIEAPTVTPIDPPAAAPPAAAPPAAAPPAAAPPAAAPPAAAPPAAALAKPAGGDAPRELVAKPRVRPPTPPAAPAHTTSAHGELADPFARPGDRPKPRDPSAPSPIVDPF
jgi:hypothetical protein